MIRKLLIVSALLALLGAAGWYGWRWYTTPVPPDVPLGGTSPEVKAMIEKGLEEVRRQPRSSKAWGELGLLLFANGYDKEASSCLTQAERFAPEEPRWPYHHGVVLGLSDRQAGFAKLRKALELARRPEQQVAVLSTLVVALVGGGKSTRRSSP